MLQIHNKENLPSLNPNTWKNSHCDKYQLLTEEIKNLPSMHYLEEKGLLKVYYAPLVLQIETDE